MCQYFRYSNIDAFSEAMSRTYLLLIAVPSGQTCVTPHGTASFLDLLFRLQFGSPRA